MASITIVARKRRKHKNGRAPLRLRISHDGARRFIRLDLDVVLSSWRADAERVRRSHPNAHAVNAYLQRIRSEAEAARAELASRGYRITADRLARAIRERLDGQAHEEQDFLSFAREHLDGYRRRGQHGTHRSYRAILCSTACPFSQPTATLAWG